MADTKKKSLTSQPKVNSFEKQYFENKDIIKGMRKQEEITGVIDFSNFRGLGEEEDPAVVEGLIQDAMEAGSTAGLPDYVVELFDQRFQELPQDKQDAFNQKNLPPDERTQMDEMLDDEIYRQETKVKE